MSVITVVTKAPADVLDYDVDFTRWLQDGDIIIEATAVIVGAVVEEPENPEINPLIANPEPPPTPILIDSVEFSNTVIKVWASSGADGDEEEILVTAITQGGRTKVASFRLRIEEC